MVNSAHSVASAASTSSHYQSANQVPTGRRSHLHHVRPVNSRAASNASDPNNHVDTVRSSTAGRVNAQRMGAPVDSKWSRMCFATLGGAMAGAGAGFVITCMGWLGLRNHMNKGVNIHANDLDVTDVDGNFGVALKDGQFVLNSVNGSVPVEITAGGGVMVDGIKVGNIDLNLLIDAGATVQIDEFTGTATISGGDEDKIAAALESGIVNDIQLDGDVSVSIDNQAVGVDIGPFPPVLLLVAAVGVFSAVIGFAAMVGERLILLSQRQHPPVEDMRQSQNQNQAQLLAVLNDLRAEVTELRDAVRRAEV
jgi:hypothetical protein